MFEATGWNLVEPSSEDTTKYDNLCPTVVTWKPEKVSKDGTTDSLPQVLLRCPGFYWVLLGFTGFYWILLGFTGFYWV